MKKTTIKISGNEVLSIDDSDVLHCYQDLWKTAQERSNSQYQGIDLSDDSNVTRIRVGAGNKDETETEDAAIAAAYGNRYHIPLDFELLESHMPFYQSALGDRLEYELTFNDYSRVVVATGDAAASYSIENIALEHLKVPDDPFYMAWCAIMSSTPTQKNIVNDLYHAAVVGGLAIGYAKLGQMVFKGPLPRLDLTPRDAGMVVLDLSAAMATKDMLIKQGLIPSDIVK